MNKYLIAYLKIFDVEYIDDESGVKYLPLQDIAGRFTNSVVLAFDGANVHADSDTIIIYRPIENNADLFAALRTLTLEICKKQLYNVIEYNAFMSGAVVVGDVAFDGNKMHGKGIDDAKKVEENALYPRILVSNNVIRRASRGLSEIIGEDSLRITYKNMWQHFHEFCANEMKLSLSKDIMKDILFAPVIAKDKEKNYYIDCLQHFKVYASDEYEIIKLLEKDLTNYSRRVAKKIMICYNHHRHTKPELLEKYEWCVEQLKTFIKRIDKWKCFNSMEVFSIQNAVSTGLLYLKLDEYYRNKYADAGRLNEYDEYGWFDKY